MIQMCVLFATQHVLDLVNDNYVLVALPENAMDNIQRDLRKKDRKELFYIHQCVDVNVFEKIVDSTIAKVAQDTLARCYADDASVKKVKLQSLRKQY